MKKTLLIIFTGIILSTTALTAIADSISQTLTIVNQTGEEITFNPALYPTSLTKISYTWTEPGSIPSTISCDNESPYCISKVLKNKETYTMKGTGPDTFSGTALIPTVSGILIDGFCSEVDLQNSGSHTITFVLKGNDLAIKLDEDDPTVKPCGD